MGDNEMKGVGFYIKKDHFNRFKLYWIVNSKIALLPSVVHFRRGMVSILGSVVSILGNIVSILGSMIFVPGSVGSVPENVIFMPGNSFFIILSILRCSSLA
jgi:hypothetical protein